MPTYDLRCDDGHEFERLLRFSELDHDQYCECGRPATRLIRPPMIYVQPNVCYDSPIDGRPITSRQARLEDLKRSGCIEYDPGMKQDYERRLKDNDTALDRNIEQSIEHSIAQLPARKRETLESELRAGVTAEPVRLTAE